MANLVQGLVWLGHSKCKTIQQVAIPNLKEHWMKFQGKLSLNSHFLLN